MRQPIYVAFALTLWTGPVWTPDHLLLAAAWTLYCVTWPALKERRYRAAYGDRFERYRQLVPYWFPALLMLDAITSLAAIVAPAIGMALLARVGDLPRSDWRIGSVFLLCAGLQAIAWWLARRRLARGVVASEIVTLAD